VAGPAVAPVPSTAALASFTGTSRFQLLRHLGHGSSGVVFEALDREREARLALKVLAHRDADSLARFKREFRALQGLHHPNLVERGELISESEFWFFTMELVDGVDFLAYVRGQQTPSAEASSPALANSRDVTLLEEPPPPPAPPAPPGAPGAAGFIEERLRSVLRQLADGLASLHAAGKVHRDIKPGNVLVTAAGRLVILDGGLMADLAEGPARPRRPGFSGTVTFMAPEQAQGAVTAAADWYSLGVMLHCALTGQPPFQGGFSDVMREKLAGAARPSSLVPGVPGDLDQLCAELLRPDPAARPPGAQIVARLGGRPLSDRARAAPVFVGRKLELEQLLELAGRATLGAPTVALVEGESGVGKSALLARFIEALGEQPSPPLILRGRCFEREAVPFKAFEGIMEAVSEHLAQLPGADAREVVPHDGWLLGLAFPALQGVVQASVPANDVEPHELRTRLFAASRELLVRLARQRLVVLAIDDLHWADADSLALLAEILRGPAAQPLLIAATTRVTADPLLLPAGTRRIPLGNLPGTDARQLAALLVRDRGLTDAAVAAIADDSGGHPLFIHELAHAPGRTAAPRNLEAALLARLERLEGSARRMLEVLAVATTPLPALAAARAAKLDPSELDGPNALLRAERLTRTAAGSGAAIEPYHDRVRQTVLAALPPDARRDRHHQLALALENMPGADLEALAIHFGEAGQRDKTCRYAMLAAEQACQALAFERATRMFHQALAATDDPQLRHNLQVKLADALASAGRSMEAAEQYQAARDGATADEALELSRRVAHHLLQGGRIDEGLAAIAEVLGHLNLELPRTPGRALLSLLWHRARLRLRPRGTAFRHRSESALDPAVLRRIDASWSAAIGLAMVDNIRGATFQAHNLHMALSAGEPVRVVRALAMEATLAASTGQGGARRAHKLIRQAEVVAGQVQEPAAGGFARLCAGAVAFLGGRWRQSLELCEDAERTFRERCTGVSYEVDQAQLFTIWSRYFLGQMGELIERVPRLVARAEDRGDLYAAVSMSSGLANMAWLALDQVTEAQQRLLDAERRWSNQSFQFQHYWYLLARTQIDLYLNDGPAAHARVLASWPAFARSLLLRVQNIRIEARGFRGRAALAAARGPDGAALLAEAAREARAIARERTDNARGIAALIGAGVAARRGQQARALAELQIADSAFTAADMVMHAHCARHVLGSLQGGDAGAAAMQAAVAGLAQQRVARPEHLIRMLAPGFESSGT
jgi:eukaryotic-like serine/threonine-protein kinase